MRKVIERQDVWLFHVFLLNKLSSILLSLSVFHTLKKCFHIYGQKIPAAPKGRCNLLSTRKVCKSMALSGCQKRRSIVKSWADLICSNGLDDLDSTLRIRRSLYWILEEPDARLDLRNVLPIRQHTYLWILGRLVIQGSDVPRVLTVGVVDSLECSHV